MEAIFNGQDSFEGYNRQDFHWILCFNKLDLFLLTMFLPGSVFPSVSPFTPLRSHHLSQLSGMHSNQQAQERSQGVVGVRLDPAQAVAWVKLDFGILLSPLCFVNCFLPGAGSEPFALMPIPLGRVGASPNLRGISLGTLSPVKTHSLHQ